MNYSLPFRNLSLKHFCLFISILSTLLKSQGLLADDELIIIQAVSKSGKSFVIRKGAEEGVAQGQESLFSSKDSSFTAVAIESNRFFSLWRLKDKRGAVPFKKNDYVTYTNDIDAVWTEIPKLQLLPKEELVFKRSYEFIFRGAYSLALSEAVSNVDNDSTESRIGFQLEALYGIKFAVHWEGVFGLRVDRENATISNPSLDIPTNRFMLAGEVLYHFSNFERTDNNAYVGLGMAYGFSDTTVSDSVSTGFAMVMPIAKIGYINRLTSKYSLVFEASIESIAQKESYLDTEVETTNIVNSKFSIGLRI